MCYVSSQWEPNNVQFCWTLRAEFEKSAEEFSDFLSNYRNVSNCFDIRNGSVCLEDTSTSVDLDKGEVIHDYKIYVVPFR